MMSCDKTYFVEIDVGFVMDNLESSNHKCQIWSKSWKRNKDNKKKLKYYMNISSSNYYRQVLRIYTDIFQKYP